MTYLFSERPYANVLLAQYLRSHCSTCFAPLTESPIFCDGQCHEVVYCCYGCSDYDKPLHANECWAYRNGHQRSESAINDTQVRLLGRILKRQKLDNGVTHLSTDFPTHLAESRRLKDLVGHDRKTNQVSLFRRNLKTIKHEFYKFFAGTPMAEVKSSKLIHMYNVARINGFSVTCLESADPESMVNLGEAIYLDASRFDHSCDASLVFSFTGCQLIVRRVDGGSTTTMTKKEFKNLTFNYGFGTQWNNNSAMSLNGQRIDSLKFRYFFRCRCKLCSDDRATNLQRNASTMLCHRCSQPYAWSMEGATAKKLKKTCECPYKDKTFDRLSVRVQDDISWLNQKWLLLMTNSLVRSDADSIMKDFGEAIDLAAKHWHPVYNLRYGQLHETLLHNWNNVVRKLRESNHPYDDELGAALTAGENMLKSYLHYAHPCDLTLAVLMQRLAGRYLLKNDDPDASNRAAELYRLSSKVWSRCGEEECSQFLLDLGKTLNKKIDEEETAL